MTKIVVGTQNVLHSNNGRLQSEDLNNMFQKVDLGFGQECYGVGFIEGVRMRRQHDIGIYRPRGWASSEPIFHNRDVFRPAGPKGKHKSHDGVAGLTPTRGTVWRLFEHIETSALVLAINKHPINGYAKDKPPAEERRKFAKIDWLEFSMLYDSLDKEYYPDFSILAGDLNARITNRDRWWYPGNILREDWEVGRGFQNGIDQILVSRQGPAHVTAKHTYPANSDHRLRTAVVSW